MAQANGIALNGVEDIQAAFVKPLMASQAVDRYFTLVSFPMGPAG